MNMFQGAAGYIHELGARQRALALFSIGNWRYASHIIEWASFLRPCSLSFKPGIFNLINLAAVEAGTGLEDGTVRYARDRYSSDLPALQ